MKFSEMQDGQKVCVRLHGEPDDMWHLGFVIKARKMWVQICAEDKICPNMIADESNIQDCRPA